MRPESPVRAEAWRWGRMDRRVGIRAHRAARRGVLSSLLVAAVLSPVALPTTAERSTVISSGSRRSGAVALTFDDGWGSAACEQIAGMLRTPGAKATFFINGYHLNAHPARWRRTLRGMPVGNHTRSHRDLVEQSDRVVRKQIRP